MTTKLEKIRLSRGLSQNRLSELSGVHQQTISLIEKGKPIQNLRQVQKLANALNCNPSDLVEVDRGYDQMTAQDLKNIHKFLQATFEFVGADVRTTARMLGISDAELKDFQAESENLSVNDGLMLAFFSLLPVVAKNIFSSLEINAAAVPNNDEEAEVLSAFRALTPEERERFIHLIKATPLLREK